MNIIEDWGKDWGEFREIRSIIKSIEDSKFSKESELMSTARNTLEPFVFKFLEKKYGQVLQEHWNSCTIPKVSDKAILMIERRCHPNIQFCIQNAVYFARGYSLYIVCSKANEDFIRTICGSQVHNIFIVPLFDDISTPAQGTLEWNNLVKTEQFWDLFQEEHIILIQTDSYFVRPIPESIFQYDYVASKWRWNTEEPGGGGLSYRKRSVMKRICNEFANSDIKGYPEDSFFSQGVIRLNLNYQKFLEEKPGEIYFTESLFSPFIIGTHQWYTFIAGVPDPIKYEVFKVYLKLQLF